jgi:hypothetical protein
LAVIGDLNALGQLAESVSVTATTIDGASTADSTFDGAGIQGVDGGTVLTAGPSDGDVSGQILAGGSVVASTVGTSGNNNADLDDATATISTSTIAGLSDVDITAGQSGTNLVLGTSLGDFEAIASSTEGDATATSDVNAFGIRDADGDGTIKTSGGIRAIANLSTSVVANTVNGDASATATADAVGLSGYNITILGSGSLDASALSSSSGIATSVIGTASA